MKLHARWQNLTPRERSSVSVVASAVGLLLVWLVAMAPAITSLQESHLQRDQLAQQHVHLLGMQAKAVALQKQTPLSRDEALRRLQQSIAAVPGMQLLAQAERVSVQIKGVPAPTLAQWLAQARTQAQALPLEAHLTRGGNTSQTPAGAVVWDGQLVMRLPSRNTPL